MAVNKTLQISDIEIEQLRMLLNEAIERNNRHSAMLHATEDERAAYRAQNQLNLTILDTLNAAR